MFSNQYANAALTQTLRVVRVCVCVAQVFASSLGTLPIIRFPGNSCTHLQLQLHLHLRRRCRHRYRRRLLFARNK